MAFVFEHRHPFGRPRSQINDLDFFVSVSDKARIIEREIADNDRNDLFLKDIREL